jgi:RNA polymerase sigma factor (sigma-70 family)
MTDREIYEEVREPLMRFASSLVGWQNAADLVSEVIVSTLQKRTLSSLDDPKAYLMRSVLNRARSWGRRAAREQTALARLDPNLTVHDSGGVDAAVDLARFVADLPVQQRAAVYLVYWEDLAPTGAARFLGLRPATVRRYLHDARIKMKEILSD